MAQNGGKKESSAMDIDQKDDQNKEKVESKPKPEKEKEQKYNPLLSNMVDFVLNPDLQVAGVDFVSDEEDMSESSD